MLNTKSTLLLVSLLMAHSISFALIGGQKVTQRDPKGPSRAVVMIELKRNNTHLSSCSGTLISDNALLTAAHCFDHHMIPGANNFDVVFEIFENGEPTRVLRRGLRAVKHPQYAGSGPVQQLLQYDIAVAFFEGTMPMGMDSVELDRNVNAQYGGKTVQVFGYGRSVDYRKTRSKDPSYSIGTLRTASIRYQPHSSVQHLLFTSHDEETSAYLCQGDSGGPHFITTTDGIKLIAVTSAAGAVIGEGEGSMTCIHPGSASLIAPAADWIEKQLRGH